MAITVDPKYVMMWKMSKFMALNRESYMSSLPDNANVDILKWSRQSGAKILKG